MRKRLSSPLYLGHLLGGFSACQDADNTTPGQVIRAETQAQASDCPNGAPMLIVANEVSGTVAVLQPTH